MLVLRTLTAKMTVNFSRADSGALQINSLEGSLIIEWNRGLSRTIGIYRDRSGESVEVSVRECGEIGLRSREGAMFLENLVKAANDLFATFWLIVIIALPFILSIGWLLS